MCHNVGHRLEGAEHSTTDGKDSSKLPKKNCLKKSKISLIVVIDMVVVGVKYKYYVCELLFPEFLQSIPKKPTSCFNV